MKKITLIALLLVASFTSQAQEKKPDSLVVHIEMDSTTWSIVITLIKENILPNSLTNKMILENILVPLYNYRFEPRTKPKPIK